MQSQSALISVLTERGFINQCTDLSGLDRFAAEETVRAYIGFDLTADSLHVGSLIQLMVLRWLRKLGHRPIVLFGEGTTLIGDPSGKTTARPMLSPKTVSENCAGIEAVIEQIVGQVATVTNRDWVTDMSVMDYLRDFGPHFSINRMLTFDSVKNRMGDNQSLSFLEFNYMLFQAIDFYLLHSGQAIPVPSCELQIGGSDQWGNIVNGVELIRRKNAHDGCDSRPAFGLTTPLMTNTAGEKMGKTANGAVWLSAEKTSIFDFWQFWRNVEDAKVREFLLLFTELTVDDIERISAGPINDAKVILADEVTSIVHSREAAAQVRAALSGESAAGLPTTNASFADEVATILVAAGLCSSKSDAARLAAQGGIRVNGKSVSDVRIALSTLASDEAILAVGKKRRCRVINQ